MNLGITFLQKNKLKLVCTEEVPVPVPVPVPEVTMPVKDGSTSRARLVDGGCISFENRRSEKICRETREQEISAHTWRISKEKINIF